MTMLRGIVWKLADQTLVFADGRGFWEMAVPGNAPAGFLRYISRLLMTLGLVDYVWPLMFLGIGLILGLALYLALKPLKLTRHCSSRFTFALSCVIAQVITWLPLFGVGSSVWVLVEPAFVVMQVLGLAVALFLSVLARRFSFLGGTLLAFLLYVPFGFYALFAAVLIGVQALCARKWCAGVVALLAASLMLPVSRSLVYRDRAYPLMWVEGGAPRLEFHTGIDLGPQLAMERCVRNQDWTGVMAIANETRLDSKHDTLRLEIAYRILAQFHLGTVMDEAFDYPINTCHTTTDAQESLMDGYILLYNYGLMGPARRECYEMMSTKNWQPVHYQILGDIALIRGENALAYRNYHQLARCPFRKQTDRKYLEKLAGFARVWQSWAAEKELPFFTTDGQSIESFIYGSFHALKNANEPMVKMFIAASLLENDVKVLTENFNLLDYFCPPPKPWPRPVQQAIVDYLNALKGAEQQKLVAQIRPYAIEADALNNYRRYPYYHYAHAIFAPLKLPTDR